MTPKESAQVLAVLTAAYPNAYKNMTDNEAAAVAIVWASQFADIPYDVVFFALQKAISTSKFPPTICEVKEKLSSLYWEAWEAIEAHDNIAALSSEELAKYKHIYNATKKYKYKPAEPELPAMLTHSQHALLTGPEGE